ncbi:hypothetical protein XENOCAPTIV_028970 [Xenoophorus captivus]|uniref:Uncharacterized protein n=1 Tax=Xenoophorus captivus TaxID=1517983 RepID=A0ABV0S0T5_9TELE
MGIRQGEGVSGLRADLENGACGSLEIILRGRVDTVRDWSGTQTRSDCQPGSEQLSMPLTSFLTRCRRSLEIWRLIGAAYLVISHGAIKLHWTSYLAGSPNGSVYRSSRKPCPPSHEKVSPGFHKHRSPDQLSVRTRLLPGGYPSSYL